MAEQIRAARRCARPCAAGSRRRQTADLNRDAVTAEICSNGPNSPGPSARARIARSRAGQAAAASDPLDNR